jgi:hypothetical protein
MINCPYIFKVVGCIAEEYRKEYGATTASRADRKLKLWVEN